MFAQVLLHERDYICIYILKNFFVRQADFLADAEERAGPGVVFFGAVAVRDDQGLSIR